jgi:transposase
MRKTKEVLRQRWVLGLSYRAIAVSQHVGEGTVSDVLRRAKEAGLVEWVAVQDLDEASLERRLYKRTDEPWREDRPLPDFAALQAERHKVGVTLELLHLEYLERHPDGYRYSQFCEYFRRWLKTRGISMRQPHHAGEKAFVDYSGKKPHIVDPSTGELIEVELFVMVLGASNYSYVEATRTQTLPDFIGSHVRALSYFGRVPAVFVPDQLKSAVMAPCRYEPGINRTYEALAEHYGAVVIPARARKPKDKAKVEVGVLIAQRWILARLRNQTFFSLDALNERIAELLEEFNTRIMRVYRQSRRALFEELDGPAMRPLPTEPYEYAEWAKATVNRLDYHVEIDGHYYSVHYTLRGQEVWTRSTTTAVEIFHQGDRKAAHRRSYQRGRHTTVSEHMPKAHQQHSEWTPTRMIEWATKTAGPETGALVSAILEERTHPEQGYRSCLGIIRLGKQYGAERLEAASARALAAGARSYRHVAAILKNGLDRLPVEPEPAAGGHSHRLGHENIRGPRYYH